MCFLEEEVVIMVALLSRRKCMAVKAVGGER
jgi:hypothetical protein